VVEKIIAARQEVEVRLTAPVGPPLRPVVAEVRRQLDELVYPGFVLDTGAGQLPQLPRYLTAMARRLDDAAADLARDRDRQAQVEVALRDLDELRAKLADRVDPEQLAGLRWMIEEFRVSLFAQQLGTAHPVSVRRIQHAMDDVEDAVAGRTQSSASAASGSPAK